MAFSIKLRTGEMLQTPRARKALILLSCIGFLTGCSFANDMNPVESDKRACEKLAEVNQQLGEPIGLKGDSAQRYADVIDSEVQPLASSYLGARLSNLSASLKIMSSSSGLEKIGAISPVLEYADQVGTRCIQILLKDADF